MSSTQILNTFKSNLLDFFDELMQLAPQEKDLVVIKFMLNDRIPITQVMDYFVTRIIPIKASIAERDSRVFADIFGMLPQDQAKNLSNLWYSNQLEKDDRETIWKWIDGFLKIAERYEKTRA